MPLYIIVPDRDPLLDSLVYLAHSQLIPLARVALLDAFWSDPSPLFDPTLPQADAYFSYFETQVRLALYNWQKYRIPQLQLKHVVDISKMMVAGSNRTEMEGYVGDILEGDARAIASEVVDLTVRLFLCVPIWSFWQGVSHEETCLTWVDGTVQGAFLRHFKGGKDRKSPKLSNGWSSPGLSAQSWESEKLVKGKEKPTKLERDFTARNLEEVVGLRVVWTGNLLDHLLIREEDGTVAIFHHAAFLHYQAISDIYPKGLLSETLRTLSLLLPPNDANARDWFVRQQIQLPLDGEAARQRALSKDERYLEKFDFWRGRLRTLKAVYDRTKPPPPKSLLRRYLSAIQMKS